MPQLISAPPFSTSAPVTEILHGVPVTDPFRWLEDQNSPRTREWIGEQSRYARAYLDNIPGRETIRKRIREFLAVETCDMILQAGDRYFFRKRLPDQEQPCIYMREGPEGQDQLLVDPFEIRQGIHTSVKPLCASQNGHLLLYETKEGGERTGTFQILDIKKRRTLPDVLPRGYLRGFAFSPDGESFLYVHEPLGSHRSHPRAAYRHTLGTDFRDDKEIFCPGEGPRIRLGLLANSEWVGFLVRRFEEKTSVDFYLKPFDGNQAPECVLAGAEYRFGPLFAGRRLFAITDRDAPNLRIVELRFRENAKPEWVNVVPESSARIQRWLVASNRILVSYLRRETTKILIFDLEGNRTKELTSSDEKTIRLSGGSPENKVVFLETESFTRPIAISRLCPGTGEMNVWAQRTIPFDETHFTHARLWFQSKDGTRIPMYLVGRRDVMAHGCHPAIMTSYGGYGVPMTPQFSVFVTYLIERGCLFALPNVRGGSEFGAAWHEAARRRKRQTAYDDFVSAAEWLIGTGRTTAGKLAIFGGSNSGLLAAAAMTQRPDLFRAVLLMVPMLDMLRYHLFDGARIWQDEFGTADDPEDFSALLQYSPYHQVRPGVEYPATMIVSGDADQNCNPLHARKMTARLQSANVSGRPIFLDYSEFRGHSPVLPLTDRIEALTDRMAFLADLLQLPNSHEGAPA